MKVMSSEIIAAGRSALDDGTPEMRAGRRMEQQAIERARCERMRHLSTQLDAVLHAATYLIGVGIRIRRVTVDRRATVIQVESTPFLHRLFAGDCAWRAQHQEGDVTVHTWFAIRYGVRIEWDERQ